MSSFTPHHRPRILAVDPGTRLMGVAVLEDPRLIYYGVKSFRDKRPADALIRATRESLEELIARYHPDILAYEKTFYVQSKNSALLQVQESEIRRVGKIAGLRIMGYSPTRVRSLLCQDGRATKQIVARVLAERFPELDRYRVSSTPKQEKYWLNMFDAIAVGVVCTEEMSAAGNGGRQATVAA
jgi:Holliday junction resolvasome RuvABC endonuclease subunit